VRFFPFQVESPGNGVDDAVYALHIDEADHGPSAAAHRHEAALDHIGSAQPAPQVPGQSEGRQQFGQIALQASHHAAIVPLPARPKAAKGGLGLGPTFRQVDGLRSPVHLVVVALAHMF